MRDIEDDHRNVADEFKQLPHEEIVRELDERGSELEIAIENLERDFNMGTIVRTANAFGVRRVHVVGRRQWNKRGAMMTDKYMAIEYHATTADFIRAMRHDKRVVVAVENNVVSVPLGTASLPLHCVLVFGSEGNGISTELLASAATTVRIEQFGSTRSVNVGVAAGVAMYAWLQQHRLA